MAINKNFLPGFLIFTIVAISIAAEARDLPLCNFPAIFNFGDSNSDTGGYFKGPKIRRMFSDGRLIMDFFTEKMGRPYLHCQYFEKELSTGANFASGGSTILKNSVKLYLANQTLAFTKFKAQTVLLQSKGKVNSTLPRPEDFPKALYTIDMGQNDLSWLLCGPYVQEISNLIRVFEEGVKTLYNEGARFFWIHNSGPIGCLPGYDYTRTSCTTRELDEFGCIKHDNQVALEFNKQLKEKLIQLRTELKGTVITYVDVYTVKYNIFKNAKNLGFSQLSCNGTCADPTKFILWDNIHYTEAANRFVVESIFNGAFSDPAVSITQTC